MARAKGLKDVNAGKYGSLFGDRPQSDVKYGPGEADYITVRDNTGAAGPLIAPYGMFFDFLGVPAYGPGSIENLEGTPREPLPQIIPDQMNSPWRQRVASVDNGVRSDATMAPQPMATPSTAGAKADARPESADPLSMMFEALASLFHGTVPMPGMGGGETVMGKGEQSPYVQLPEQIDMPTRNPAFATTADERVLAEMLQGPGNSVEMTNPGPMQREAMKAAQAQAQQTMPQEQPQFTSSVEPAATPEMPNINPPVPTPNPSFHSTGGPDLRSIGVLLQQMFAPQNTKGLAPPMPQRNPNFTGGV